MTGYRDRFGEGAHTVVLEGVRLDFDAAGVLWQPTDIQQAVLTRTSLRRDRFLPVVEPDVTLPVSEAESQTDEGPVATEAAAENAEFTRGRRGSGRRSRRDVSTTDETPAASPEPPSSTDEEASGG